MTEPADAQRGVVVNGVKIHGARKVLPGDRRDDFLRWVHEGAGENPLVWQASARDLLDAASAVKARVIQFDDGMMHTLAAVEAMLLGLALECLLKGMYIKRHRVWEEADKAHAIVKNGEYVGVPGAGDHELLQVADVAGVALNQQDRWVLSCSVTGREHEARKKGGRGNRCARVYLARRTGSRRGPREPPNARSRTLDVTILGGSRTEVGLKLSVTLHCRCWATSLSARWEQL